MSAPVGEELPTGAVCGEVLEPLLAEVCAVAFGQRPRDVREDVEAGGRAAAHGAAVQRGRIGEQEDEERPLEENFFFPVYAPLRYVLLKLWIAEM